MNECMNVDYGNSGLSAALNDASVKLVKNNNRNRFLCVRVCVCVQVGMIIEE